MAMGKKIKELREAKKLTQAQLCELTNGEVSQGAISALEKRDSTTSKYAPALAKALNVDVTILYGVDTNESEDISKYLTPEIIKHIMVMQQLPDYARSEVIRDAIKTAELITKATTAATSGAPNGEHKSNGTK